MCSNIKVELTVKRFEQDLFAIDTNHRNGFLNQLGHKISVLPGRFPVQYYGTARH